MKHIKSVWFLIGSMIFTCHASTHTFMNTFENGSATHSVIATSSVVAPEPTADISKKSKPIIKKSATDKSATGKSATDKSTKDLSEFESYVKYLSNIKNVMSSVKVKEVSFPVKQSDISDQTFIRNGFLVTRPGALGTVIICHGYTQSKHESFFFRALFSHFNVLAFDFRAHGDLIIDQHSTIGKDEIHDVWGAAQFVKSNPDFASKPIIGFGFSMGAVSLLMAQAHFQNLFDLLILDSPFDSSDICMLNRLDELLSYKFLPGKEWIKSAIMKGLYSENWQSVVKPIFKMATGLDPHSVSTKFVPVIPINIASKITIPCLFISCENDKKVTVDSVKRLYDQVGSPFKRLWITQGTRHCGSCLAQPEIYLYMVNKFIKKSLSKKWSNAEKIIDNRVMVV
ncbi:MAG: alpha/beta fold hydrolase [Candidatus Dependentiae bacterium]|nr:alpha/beta fold hydrolase [Candidatus Dependentiae bacterium]